MVLVLVEFEGDAAAHYREKGGENADTGNGTGTGTGTGIGTGNSNGEK